MMATVRNGALRRVPPTRILALLFLALPLSACDSLSSFDPLSPLDNISLFTKKEEVVPDTPAEVLYNDGLARMNRKSYSGAVKKFAEVDKQYPYSTWSKKALLLTVSANYESSDWAEAINAGKRYVQLYPASPEAPYAQYIVGMSYYNQMPDVERDQERTEKALDAFDELIRKWPQSEYVPDAKERVEVTRDQLAGKEMDVGRHYLMRHNYIGAINRFRTVLVKYQTTRHVEEALARLTEAYMSLGIVAEAQTAAAVLLGHNYPDSQWYKDSYKLLQTGGLEPRESGDSWISKTFKGVTPHRWALSERFRCRWPAKAWP